VKGAEHRANPKRWGAKSRNDGDVVDCGSALPLFVSWASSHSFVFVTLMDFILLAFMLP
jgi:hypothetical protein